MKKRNAKKQKRQEKSKRFSARASLIGVRSRKKNGQWSHHLLVTNLSLEPFQQLSYLPKMWHHCPEPILWYALLVVDLRGGGCETEEKADTQGLGMTQRNQKKFEAQQMLQLLADLAHNLCIWVKTALASQRHRFESLGILRPDHRSGCLYHFGASGFGCPRTHQTDSSQSKGSIC